MKYSIIIAVYNRLQEVKELLASAEKLDFDRGLFELLFVDDGSSDGFKSFISNYKSPSGLQTRAVFQSNQGPGEARNHGMRVSEATYFIFADSDCMFPPHWLRTIDKALNEENYDAFGGPDTYHESFSSLLKAINYSMTSFIGTGGTRGSKKSVGKFYPRSFNMGVDRKVYETIGGMSKLRHGQDMDFSARIYAKGYKVGLVADAFVYHKRRTSLSKFYRQIFNWGVARINLSRLHPNLLKPVHLLPSMIVLGYALLIILSLFSGIARSLLLLAFMGHVAITLFAAVQSFMKYRDLKAAILSMVTLNIQIFAYGLGLLKALWQTKILGKKEASGFVKNYYGKKKPQKR